MSHFRFVQLILSKEKPMFTSPKTQEDVANMENEGNRPVHELKHDVKDGARRLRNDVREAASNVRDAASNLKHDVEDVARRTGRHAREIADATTGSVTEFSQSLTSKIRENPVQSSVIALVAGIFVGLLSRRR
jgi:ElaB/YqjD/DUF883 family membrane-anchored ribosome-binding protein